ncbi:hypothetical protein [Sulfuricurvum sp.]|uniref:hypothetical protein n=1 Tax=Sulfuricurvum sp. TaxID=2025608 RepID=UPI00272D9CCD|nr:hypothetical protein [Sulfuricurvum sp.]
MKFKRETTMLNILREAQEQFQKIHKLLRSNALRNSAYYAHLNMATQEAYITMNEGMCANTTVCHQCAEHRDFLHSMLSVLEELEAGNPLSTDYETKLKTFSEKVTEILKKISAVLTSF